jgi:endo-1,4-beta-xylanase
MSERSNESTFEFNRRRLLTLAGASLLAATAFFGLRGGAESPHEPERQEVSGEVTITPEQLRHMPGAIVEANGLRIKNTGYAFTEQDGTEAMANPPVSLAGAHLEVDGNFAIGAAIEAMGTSVASLQLYGRPPIIADEFRVERESVRFTVKDNKVSVTVWDGSKQEPVETKDFTFAPADKNKLIVLRANDALTIRMNGQNLGSLQEHDVFDTGAIWFGADSVGGDWLLSELAAAEVDGGKLAVVDTSHMEVTASTPGLQHYAAQKRPGFTIGYAGALTPLMTDQAYRSAMANKENFGGVTTENALKMKFTQPQEGAFTFQEVDALVNFARRNGQTVHGHALVFGEANPQWFNAIPTDTPEGRQRVEAIMLDRIKTVVGRYKDTITSWDVINEPIADYEQFTPNNPMREHAWFKAMGEDYMVKALAAAHEANPQAKLFINDYGLEADDERWDAFIEMLQRLAPKLQAHGVPIDTLGVGFQSHIYERGDKIDPDVLRRHIQQLEGMGIVSQVSELDVYSGDGDDVQAAQYSDVLAACLQEQSCVAYRIWIASDRYNYWKDDNRGVNQGKDGLYDADMHPRPAYNRLLQSLK